MGEREIGGDDDSSFSLLSGYIGISLYIICLYIFNICHSVAYASPLGYNLCMFGSAIRATLINRMDGEDVL